MGTFLFFRTKVTVNCLQKCRGTVSNSVSKLSQNAVSGNCLVDEFSCSPSKKVRINLIPTLVFIYEDKYLPNIVPLKKDKKDVN